MYDYIKGIIAEKGTAWVVVEAGGIGYRINVSAADAAAMGNVGDIVMLYIYQLIRENINELYGFLQKQQRVVFLQLMSVKGVGAKVALSILSIASPYDIAVAIINNNAGLIKSAPGVGAKTADRIILELKDKVSKGQGSFADRAVSAAAGSGDVVTETINALLCLGYSADVAIAAAKDLPPDITSEQAVKLALRKML